MLFVDNIVLVDKSIDGVNANLKRWQEALKSKRFKISCTKMEYMDCNLNWQIQKIETIVRIQPRKYYKEIHSIALAQ